MLLEADVIEALEHWEQLHAEAERLYEALPDETRAAVETAGVDISGLAAWLATLPSADREHLREIVHALWHLARHRWLLTPRRMCGQHVGLPSF